MALVLSTAANKLSLRQDPLSLLPPPPSSFSGFKQNKRILVVSLAGNKSKTQSVVEKKQEGQGGYGKIGPRRGGRDPVLSEGTDEDEVLGPVCPGCGVFMQDEDPNRPGYYQQPKVVDEMELEGEEDVVDELEDDELGGSDGEEGELAKEDGLDWGSDGFEPVVFDDEDRDENLEGFSMPGVGYGNITEEVLEREMKRREMRKVSKSERKRLAREANRQHEEKDVVCARCHSLRNYGQVKNQNADNLIPDFDFDRLITNRLVKRSAKGNATVVVMVVDCVDFDGSFPKRAAKSLFKALQEAENDIRASKNLPKLVLVATKVDLLPSQISPTRLDSWVRQRARAQGSPKLAGVFLVSAHKDLGVRNLLAKIKELAGPRGNVWVIGAQNAGKSTLINKFAKKEGAKVSKLTEAPLPGTTLGILRISGILSAKAKMYDTPGLLHPYLMSTRLNRDEQKIIEVRKQLQPRTYRVKVGQTIHVGGLLRLDLNEASVQTIYITIWASPGVSLHMGKTENADEIWSNNVGLRLQPPAGKDRALELGKWEDREIKATGTSWDFKSLDIAVAGMGWISLGLKGDATLTLWSYDGVEVTLRDPLVLHRASFLERPGFWLPESISNAIGEQTRLEAQKRKRLEEEKEEEEEDLESSLSEISV